jgi:hypothetical protein
MASLCNLQKLFEYFCKVGDIDLGKKLYDLNDFGLKNTLMFFNFLYKWSYRNVQMDINIGRCMHENTIKIFR